MALRGAPAWSAFDRTATDRGPVEHYATAYTAGGRAAAADQGSLERAVLDLWKDSA